MSAKHTPGPWSFGYGAPETGITGPRAAPIVYLDETGTLKVPVRAGDRAVCWLLSSSESDNLKPDAQLIAAAPDLLRAVELLIQDHDAHSLSAAIGIARAAIAKAKGRP